MGWKRIRMISIVTVILSIAVAAIAVYDEWLVMIPLLLLTLALILLFRSERIRHRDTEIAASLDQQSHLIRTVNHLRHDWMNDLQVLFGYVQLNKQDKLKAYIEKLSDKLYRESLVSKLGDSGLIAYLITFRTENHSFSLTIQPERDINLAAFGEAGRVAARTIIEVVEAYRIAVEQGAGEVNELAISIDIFAEQVENREQPVLAIDFEFSGNYRKVELAAKLGAIEELVCRDRRGSISCDLSEGSADIEIRLQLTGWAR